MKSVFRKVAIMAIALVAMSVAAGAQEKGDMAAGGNLVLGSGDSFTNFGIGAKFQYNVTNPLRLEGSLTYFLPKKESVANLVETSLSMWDLSVNGHWLFPVAENVTLYPLAGLGILGTSSSAKLNMGDWGNYSGSGSSTELGLNLGGGIDLKLTDELIFNAELKYKTTSSWNRLLISAGLAYKF
ncbi:MAG: porin family protein [Tannerellaceae bacterium]|jgi:outer membrane protein X|nr:porin family protein [Tannerellaceae bacterium]